MTKRSAHQHRMLELRERVMAKVANRLFTFKQTGVDGFVKRKLLDPAKRPAKRPAKKPTAREDA